MWARIVEIFIGMWLILSPWIFKHNRDEIELWVNDIVSGFVVVLLATLSFREKTRYAHLLNIGIALWLIVSAFFVSSHPVPAAQQNEITIGLILLMFSIVPVEASLPPKTWLEYSSQNKNRK